MTRRAAAGEQDTGRDPGHARSRLRAAIARLLQITALPRATHTHGTPSGRRALTPDGPDAGSTALREDDVLAGYIDDDGVARPLC
jgi:hypothetical protein